MALASGLSALTTKRSAHLVATEDTVDQLVVAAGSGEGSLISRSCQAAPVQPGTATSRAAASGARAVAEAWTVVPKAGRAFAGTRADATALRAPWASSAAG